MELVAVKENLPDLQMIAKEAAEKVGIELINVRIAKQKGKLHKSYKWAILVCINREGGTSIKDCEEVSRWIEGVLDKENVLFGKYTLEVFSRGITLPSFHGKRNHGKPNLDKPGYLAADLIKEEDMQNER